MKWIGNFTIKKQTSYAFVNYYMEANAVPNAADYQTNP